ncbi:hypothetical protein R84B8_02592 [Treponema sp. R8-4-B8]
MKKILLFLIMFCIGYSLFAFDSSLIGSWGLISGSEKHEFIRFNRNEFILLDTLYRQGNYQEMNDTIYFEKDGDSAILQYFLLSANKLLFIIWNVDDTKESITLILTRL